MTVEELESYLTDLARSARRSARVEVYLRPDSFVWLKGTYMGKDEIRFILKGTTLEGFWGPFQREALKLLESTLAHEVGHMLTGSQLRNLPLPVLEGAAALEGIRWAIDWGVVPQYLFMIKTEPSNIPLDIAERVVRILEKLVPGKSWEPKYW